MSDSGLDLGLEDDYAGFFTPLENTKPYMKISFEGFPGSGKTYTMVQLAIWLHKFIGSKKPITYLDSEKAGKFLRHLFEEAGIKVLHRETRSMADLNHAMTLCRQGASDILLCDSISHFWEDFLEAYKASKNKNKNRLDFGDWGVLKPMWREKFSNPFVRDPYHAMFTGRAAFEYADEVNEETGKRESFKSGIKMRAEGETAYEPDMLVLMERHEEVLEEKKVVYRQATILKDRGDIIDGKTFRNPRPEDFAPAVERCLLAPVKKASAIEGDTRQFFGNEEDRQGWFRRKDVAIEEIEAALVEAWPGQTASEKQLKIQALKVAFQTASWTWIKTRRPEELEAGLEKVEAFIIDVKGAAKEAVDAEGPAGATSEGVGAEPKANGPAAKKPKRSTAA